MQISEIQLEQVRNQIRRVKNCGNPYYEKKFSGINPEDIVDQQSFQKLPFSTKQELRDAYPLGLAAVPEEQIVRIHSSSGTTGTPVIIPYTQKDVDDWSLMFARCYEMAGITKRDRIQITPGYGLWTAGIGFQLGCERLGAMAVPLGPGNTEKQLQMMRDLKSTVLCATSSYALLLAEQIENRGLKESINLKKGVIGSERWGDKMRARIRDILGIELYDIYGLTECYGPGIGISCSEDNGIHYFDDYVYMEILDPQTGLPVKDGEVGEITLTTLVKEGAPLFRFRTHDLAAFIPGKCKCGSSFPRITPILGRSDDMVKVKGNIIFPSTIEDVIKSVPGTSSEYRAVIEHVDGKDELELSVEVEGGTDRTEAALTLALNFKSKYNMTPKVRIVGEGELPRSEKKTRRIEDRRFE
ncbi:phenylacetate--CoA ligase family protein [Treponema peruense]|uniref:Phenylacetate-coenzyme A ligase n=1 Tax=Treponema peruense TaxID=2787628 RepID=A0A7T3REP1_9SPIR|nr:phenylacetate--CoA ligase [Treponema peruense]QQA01623.1 phenylacetate--CoA ligase [Treponema peruense]